MTITLLDFPGLTATRETQNHAGPDAWRCAEDLLRLAAGLPPMMQPVFFSWLKALANGSLTDCTLEELAGWLDGLHPDLAEAEYHLALMEIAWLEWLAADFYRFSGKGTP